MLPDQKVRLSDYTIAELYDPRLAGMLPPTDKTIEYSRGDSLPYMAPEVIQRQPPSEKSDVWSLGCTVLEMLTASTPWSSLAPTFEEAFQVISNAAKCPPLPAELTPECTSFLEACLAVKPSERQNLSSLAIHPFIRNHSPPVSSEPVKEVQPPSEK